MSRLNFSQNVKNILRVFYVNILIVIYIIKIRDLLDVLMKIIFYRVYFYMYISFSLYCFPLFLQSSFSLSISLVFSCCIFLFMYIMKNTRRNSSFFVLFNSINFIFHLLFLHISSEIESFDF